MIRIRFGTFTFDRVTRLLKANWFDKLSHIGGTVGLFTGVSFISVFEIIPFVVTLLIIPCQYYLTNKNKKIETVQGHESNATKMEKTNGDINQKLNDIIAQKLASFEKDFKETLNALEKEVKEKVDVNIMEKAIEKKLDQQFNDIILDKYGLKP